MFNGGVCPSFLAHLEFVRRAGEAFIQGDAPKMDSNESLGVPKDLFEQRPEQSINQPINQSPNPSRD